MNTKDLLDFLLERCTSGTRLVLDDVTYRQNYLSPTIWRNGYWSCRNWTKLCGLFITSVDRDEILEVLISKMANLRDTPIDTHTHVRSELILLRSILLGGSRLECVEDYSFPSVGFRVIRIANETWVKEDIYNPSITATPLSQEEVLRTFLHIINLAWENGYRGGQ